MSLVPTRTPPAILLLADHLDAVLAAGEDVMRLSVDISAVARQDGAAAPWERFADIVAQAKLYELTIVSRVLQARNRARDAGRAIERDNPAIGAVIELFASGTASLEDAVAELADRATVDFDAGLDPLAYLRTRSVIAADAGTITGLQVVCINETFRVARRIELGPLLDMAAALLDALDVAYSLFDDVRTERDEPRGEPSLSLDV